MFFVKEMGWCFRFRSVPFIGTDHLILTVEHERDPRIRDIVEFEVKCDSRDDTIALCGTVYLNHVMTHTFGYDFYRVRRMFKLRHKNFLDGVRGKP